MTRCGAEQPLRLVDLTDSSRAAVAGPRAGGRRLASGVQVWPLVLVYRPASAAYADSRAEVGP